jgi:hypothetical protein
MLPDAVSLDVKDSSNELRKYICVIGRMDRRGKKKITEWYLERFL